MFLNQEAIHLYYESYVGHQKSTQSPAKPKPKVSEPKLGPAPVTRPQPIPSSPEFRPESDKTRKPGPGKSSDTPDHQLGNGSAKRKLTRIGAKGEVQGSAGE